MLCSDSSDVVKAQKVVVNGEIGDELKIKKGTIHRGNSTF